MGFWLWSETPDRVGPAKARKEARDRHIPNLLRKCGLTPRDAEKLNVGHVYTGRRVRDILVFEDAGHSRLREVPLTRSARESIAVILDCTRSMGYPLDLEAPLLVDLNGASGRAGAGMSRFQIRRFLATGT